MSTLSRTLRAALTVLLATTLALSVNAAASGVPNAEQGTPAAATRAATSTGHDNPLDLHGDEATPRRTGRVARVQKWKVRTLYYYETMPAKWDWSLSTAVGKWNTSGGRIRLARTIYPRKAHVRISYANTGSAAGMATLGATRNARVFLSSRFSTVNALDARNRVLVMNVFAHELGHVLGFRHTSDPCSLMAPVLAVDRCGDVPTSNPGYYRCRTLDVGLVGRFIALYGGTVRYPTATWCLIDPLPPALTGVSFSGGLSSESPVTVQWTPPASTPPGSRIVVRRWESASCGTTPDWADTFNRALSPGTWQDSGAAADDPACFRVQLVNRYGAGRAASTKLLTRWVPRPAAPEVGLASWTPSDHSFHASATYAAGTHLTYVVGENLSDCPGAYTSGGQAVVENPERPGIVQFFTDQPDVCVSFYAIDNSTGRASAPTSITVEAPTPSEQLDVGALTFYGSGPTLAWYATVTGIASGNRVGAASILGPCPETVPDDIPWLTWDPPHQPSSLADEYLVLSRGLGTNCALFAAVDWFGYEGQSTARHGPVVMREFEQEGTAPPVVESTSWSPDYQFFALHYAQSDPASRTIVAQIDASDPSACPTTFDPDESYWTGHAGADLVFGIASTTATTVCVSSFYYDGSLWGQISLPTMTTLQRP